MDGNNQGSVDNVTDGSSNIESGLRLARHRRTHSQPTGVEFDSNPRIHSYLSDVNTNTTPLNVNVNSRLFPTQFSAQHSQSNVNNTERKSSIIKRPSSFRNLSDNENGNNEQQRRLQSRSNYQLDDEDVQFSLGTGLSSFHTSKLKPRNGELKTNKEMHDEELIADVEDDVIRGAKRQLELECVEIDKTGDSTSRTVSRRTIAQELRNTQVPEIPVYGRIENGYSHKRELSIRRNAAYRKTLRNGLQARDLRQMDPKFTAKPALWVRHRALVVSLEGIRAIILYNKVLVFDAGRNELSQAIRIIQGRVSEYIRAPTGSHSNTHLPEETVTTSESSEDSTPFEFKALEGILINVCLSLERDYFKIEPPILECLSTLPRRLDTERLEQLRSLELRLNHFSARSRKVQQELNELLENDEDMANMYLTEIAQNPMQNRNPLDHEEVEMILESYLQVVDDLTNRATLMSDMIDDMEGLLEIHLDSLQNRLLLFELFINLLSTLFSAGTLIASIFGMNMVLPPALSELPSSQYYFYGVVVVVFTALFIGLILLLAYFKRERLFGHSRNLFKKANSAAAQRLARTAKATTKSIAPDTAQPMNLPPSTHP